MQKDKRVRGRVEDGSKYNMVMGTARSNENQTRKVMANGTDTDSPRKEKNPPKEMVRPPFVGRVQEYF